ncbi:MULTISPECIES: ABC transporter permease [Iodobacter]|uniref:Spermidine/putrescine transport system permease protein n=2 Tax=Iodobacter TaxID=32014 RepID=A0A377Q2L7_9NEIS|nr:MULTISPECIES: ABC transporter permease [Iodobacter]NHQ85108.1 ABC transporter permease [Iodobacter violacea]TCU90025.1 spermidine/putrescine transport system permease protein [Iodobacter fluviatilis]STQ89052.1 Spermidine/putrescine transport system permease protein PotB [Iodobacter fluviatilis]
MSKVKSPGLAKWLISGPPLLYLLIFFAVPTLMMIFSAFRFPGEYGGLMPLVDINPDTGARELLINSQNWRDFLTLENFSRFFEDGVYVELFIKSFWYAGLTTLFCIILAYPLAWLIARSPKKYRDLLVLLVILPFWSNFLIRVYAWMIILGPQGYFAMTVNSVLAWFGIGPQQFLFTHFAVIVVLVYVHLPFMVLPLYANLEKHDMALLDAAQDLGASAWQRFWRITWPLSLPGVWAGAALVFIPALGMFAVPDLVGGTDGIMVGNLIKQQFLDSRDWPFGSTLSIMLTGGVLLLAVLATLISRGRKKQHD